MPPIVTGLTALASGFSPAEVRVIETAAACHGIEADRLVPYTFNIARVADRLTVGALIAEYRSAIAVYA